MTLLIARRGGELAACGTLWLLLLAALLPVPI